MYRSLLTKAKASLWAMETPKYLLRLRRCVVEEPKMATSCCLVCWLIAWQQEHVLAGTTPVLHYG